MSRPSTSVGPRKGTSTMNHLSAAAVIRNAAGLLVAAMAMTFLPPESLVAQSTGSLVGTVTNAATGNPIASIEVRLGNGRWTVRTDTNGDYRFRGIPTGSYRLEALLPGFQPARRDSIVIRQGEVIRADIRMVPMAAQLQDIVATGVMDPILDPLATQSTQRISAEDLRRMPVSSLEDAIAIQAGVVGESFRGGRVGQQAFVLDGLGVKNQLDASTGGSGLRIPPDLISDAQLITNGFSARYGQAISGLISVTTKDGGDRWSGRAAYETDRPIGGAGDLGLDRMVLQADGPISGGIRAVAIVDMSARIDFDPVNAPTSDNQRDPFSAATRPLPHNSGETWTAAGKLTMPLGDRAVGRVFGLRSIEQRYLFDPRYKYDPDLGPGSRTDATLMSGHLQFIPAGQGSGGLIGDIRVGYFSRDFARGQVDPAEYSFGAFTWNRMQVAGEDLARSQDTVTASQPVAGFGTPGFSSRTPYGVPAFFLGGAGTGEISWNNFSELKTQVDMTVAAGTTTDIAFGGMLASQKVKTFQRIDAWLPVGNGVPPVTASAFSPTITGAYVEAQARASDLGFFFGVRYDGFNPGGDLGNSTLGARSAINPRAAVSTVLSGATVVASMGRFSQPPDLQYLVNSAFDDTTRTGRFRQGNPDLGFEQGTQFELSGRIRLREHSTLKLNLYMKNLSGLVSTAPIGSDPDSSVFVNADVGEVIGTEVIFERERADGWSARLMGVVQRATATVTDAFELQRLRQRDPITGELLAAPARSQYPLDYDRRLSVIAMFDREVAPDGGPVIESFHPFGGMIVSTIFRYSSGLPYSRTNAAGDSLIGPPNDARLPAQWGIDMLFRRPVWIGGARGGVYLDIRNLTNRRNVLSVRRDTGVPDPSNAQLDALAQAAYQLNPAPIPYESSRYRRRADLDSDGMIAGPAELIPMYRAAAADYLQPLMYYGQPRLIRMGVEVFF